MKTSFWRNIRSKNDYVKNKRDVNEECQFVNSLLLKDESYDCCTYDSEKIKCSDNHIIKIQFEEEDIKNFKMPASLGPMNQLEELRLSECQIEGTIPEDIVTLKELNTIRLERNKLTGNIPSSIGSLTKLKWLELEGNKLTGNIPSSIGDLSKLEWL
ncbi:hypothetical protein PIROE2DRAFT_12951 [Piromyces sp. E2]|nr:hypothetical protein PIROE2DRAFT_12951 [Piromyces sp. E2]|eukprot:OUM61115.1 hypothetical protein PIROE2DRAFT_12951 [Piromyces sp. E2]